MTRKNSRKDRILVTTEAEMIARREAHSKLISRGVFSPHHSWQDEEKLAEMMSILNQLRSRQQK